MTAGATVKRSARSRGRFLEGAICGTQSVCPWKGTASYYSIRVGDAENVDAAWFYPEPKAAAEEIRDRVAFWRGVRIIES